MALRGGVQIQGSRWGAGTTINPSGNDGGPGGGGGGGGGGSSWVPSPPSSYKPTGTVTFSAGLNNPTNITYALFHPTYQHVVANGHGIFACYSSADNGNHDPSTWQLKHCPAGSDFTVSGNWTLMRDSSAAGDLQYGIPPALETDENDNVYLFANQLPEAGETTKRIQMFKWGPGDGYTTPTITTVSTYASGKFATFLDQGRQWIWMAFWSDRSSTQNLIAFDYNGTQQYTKNVFPSYNSDWSPSANASTDLHAASAHYPALYVATDGTVFLSWNNLAFETPGTSFYDVRMVYSTSTKAQFQAGTETWYGPQSGVSGTPSARTLPFCVDDSGAQAKLAYPIVKLSDQSEFIPATSGSYWNGTTGQYNWNRLKAVPTYNNGAVHFYYESEDDGNARVVKHRSYARFDMSNHSVSDSIRRTPSFKYDTTTAGDRAGAAGGSASGAFVQDTTQASRLYFIQLTSAETQLRVLRSDDGGSSWWLYAASAVMPRLFQASAFRWVASDGTITGIVGLNDSPGTIYTFKVTPN